MEKPSTGAMSEVSPRLSARVVRESPPLVDDVFHIHGPRSGLQSYIQLRSHVTAANTSHVTAANTSHVTAANTSHPTGSNTSHVAGSNTSHVTGTNPSHMTIHAIQAGSNKPHWRKPSSKEASSSEHVSYSGKNVNSVQVKYPINRTAVEDTTIKQMGNGCVKQNVEMPTRKNNTHSTDSANSRNRMLFVPIKVDTTQQGSNEKHTPKIVKPLPKYAHSEGSVSSNEDLSRSIRPCYVQDRDTDIANTEVSADATSTQQFQLSCLGDALLKEGTMTQNNSDAFVQNREESVDALHPNSQKVPPNPLKIDRNFSSDVLKMNNPSRHDKKHLSPAHSDPLTTVKVKAKGETLPERCPVVLAYGEDPNGKHHETYIIIGILVLIFFNLPIGLLSIYCSVRAHRYFNRGQILPGDRCAAAALVAGFLGMISTLVMILTCMFVMDAREE